MIRNRIKEIDVLKLCNFVDNYNYIGYGQAKVVETEQRIIIELYNSGFSENEELEQEYIREKHPSIGLSVEDHPCHVLSIHKVLHEHKNPTVFNKLRKLDCYSKEAKYSYKFEVE